NPNSASPSFATASSPRYCLYGKPRAVRLRLRFYSNSLRLLARLLRPILPFLLAARFPLYDFRILRLCGGRFPCLLAFDFRIPLPINSFSNSAIVSCVSKSVILSFSLFILRLTISWTSSDVNCRLLIFYALPRKILRTRWAFPLYGDTVLISL